VFAHDRAGAIRAFDPADGTPRWETRVALEAQTGIAVADGGLFVGADDRLLGYA
jgi:outer membrane protein assembly factor BamB